MLPGRIELWKGGGGMDREGQVLSLFCACSGWKIDVMRKQECGYCLEAGLSCGGTLVVVYGPLDRDRCLCKEWKCGSIQFDPSTP